MSKTRGSPRLRLGSALPKLGRSPVCGLSGDPHAKGWNSASDDHAFWKDAVGREKRIMEYPTGVSWLRSSTVIKSQNEEERLRHSSPINVASRSANGDDFNLGEPRDYEMLRTARKYHRAINSEYPPKLGGQLNGMASKIRAIEQIIFK